jgi:glutathione S-transferase
MKLWHCKGARSLRALWALEEMGLDYDVHIMPFPPRIFEKEYLGTNTLGTIPFLEDGDTTMTESTGICHYLVERYQQYDFGLKSDHPEYGDYLNWLYHSDATLTFPQTIAMRYLHLEPTPEKLPVAVDYAKWFFARLKRLNSHLETRDYLCDERFTVADIAVGYAIYLAKQMKLTEFVERDFTPQVENWYARLIERPAFLRADAMDGDQPSTL